MRMALKGPAAISDSALEAGAFTKQLSAGMPGLNQLVHAVRIDLLLPVEVLELQLVEMQDAHPAEQSSSTLQRKLHGQVRRRHGPHDAVAGHVRHSAEDRLAGRLAIEEHGIMGEVPADALARRQSLLLGRDDDFGTGQIEDVLTGLGRHDRHEKAFWKYQPAKCIGRPLKCISLRITPSAPLTSSEKTCGRLIKSCA